MAMVPFFTRFPEISSTELRFIQIRGLPTLPDGEYEFHELYCDEPDCDCRRVIIQVMSPSTGSLIWATINYGWEPLAFYENWLGVSDLAIECKGTGLDLFNAQTRYAEVLFELFKSVELEDTAYVERLKRHYTMFKASDAQSSPVKRQRKTVKRKRG